MYIPQYLSIPISMNSNKFRSFLSRDFDVLSEFDYFVECLDISFCHHKAKPFFLFFGRKLFVNHLKPLTFVSNDSFKGQSEKNFVKLSQSTKKGLKKGKIQQKRK